MSARVRTTVIASVLLSVTPGLARAGVCFDVTGLPEAASLNVVALAAPQGPIPLVGEAQGVCGLGQPTAAVQETAVLNANGAARVGLKLMAARAGYSGNLTMRMSMRRFTRLTNAFSKKVEMHAHAIALHFMHYNFARVHSAHRVSPAMQAGVTTHLWSVEEIAALLDAVPATTALTA